MKLAGMHICTSFLSNHSSCCLAERQTWKRLTTKEPRMAPSVCVIHLPVEWNESSIMEPAGMHVYILCLNDYNTIQIDADA